MFGWKWCIIVFSLLDVVIARTEWKEYNFFINNLFIVSRGMSFIHSLIQIQTTFIHTCNVWSICYWIQAVINVTEKQIVFVTHAQSLLKWQNSSLSCTFLQALFTVSWNNFVLALKPFFIFRFESINLGCQFLNSVLNFLKKGKKRSCMTYYDYIIYI